MFVDRHVSQNGIGKIPSTQFSERIGHIRLIKGQRICTTHHIYIYIYKKKIYIYIHISHLGYVSRPPALGAHKVWNCYIHNCCYCTTISNCERTTRPPTLLYHATRICLDRAHVCIISWQLAYWVDRFVKRMETVRWSRAGANHPIHHLNLHPH